MQESLARKLRVLRAERGLTLTEAAERAGVQRQTLALLERGERHPHTPTLSKIAEGYGVPVEELLEEPVPLDDAPEAGRSWQAAYEELGEELASRWEDKLEQMLALADKNPKAFFTWVQEVRDVERAYLNRLVSTYMAAVGRLEAVIGVASFMSRRRPFWRRFEEVTLTRPEDQEQQQKIVEEVKAEEEALLAA